MESETKGTLSSTGGSEEVRTRDIASRMTVSPTHYRPSYSSPLTKTQNEMRSVTVFRLRTGHNRLNYHMYSKLRIGHTEQCPCGTGSQTTEHLLQSCPTYEPLRKGIWPDYTPVARKLYRSLRDLRCTATLIGEAGVSI